MTEAPKIFNRIATLPLRALVNSLEMFVQTAQELQRLVDQSIDALMRPSDVLEADFGGNFTNRVMPGSVTPKPFEAVAGTDTSTINLGIRLANGAAGDGGQTTVKETAKMRDANLNDDMLKLVRYKVLFVKRDYEIAFPEEEDLVPENMTGADFTAWKIAEFIQKLGHRPPEVRYPKRWLTKPRPHRYGLPNNWKEAEELEAKARKAEEEAERLRRESKDAKDKAESEKRAQDAESAARQAKERAEAFWLTGFPEDDKKFLRVFYEVLERYPREKLKYEERQLEILEKIAEGVQR